MIFMIEWRMNKQNKQADIQTNKSFKAQMVFEYKYHIIIAYCSTGKFVI